MATESPIRMSETSGKWPTHKEAVKFAASSASMAAEELGLLLKGRGFQVSGRDAVPNRSGSAPPSMEGSFLSQQTHNLNASLESLSNAFQNFESEEQMRSDPAYVAFYCSNINQNPRLPLPLISSENRRLVRHIGSFGNNYMLASVDDSGNGSLRMSHGPLSTHKEESEDDQSPQKPFDDRVDGTSGFWAGQDVASLAGQHKNVVDLIQEDFPRTPSPVYSQSNLLSQGVVDEAVDHDALIGTANGVSSTLGSDDRRISSDSDPLAAPTSSSSSHDRTGRVDVNDSDVTTMEFQMKSLNISNLPNSENQKNQEQWQYSGQNNLLQHQVHQQQSNLSQAQSAKSRVISQGVNCAYVGVDQVLHNPSKFAEVQPVLQSSGFTPPLYATAAAYMASTNPFYPNLQAQGLYSPQFVGGYALNPTAVPPYIAGYPPNGAVPVVVDGTAGPSYTAQTSGVSTGGNIAHGADVQHLSKLFGQFGFPLQGSFADPIYMQYHQHPYGEAYSGITGQLDPLASRGGVNIGNQASVLDSQRGSNNAGYLEDHKFGHQINGGPSHFNPGRGGMMSPSYYGSPSNMGFVMQYPNSPLASPVLPGSPVGGTSIPGGRNEMRFAPGPGRNAGVYPGWQGQRGFESFGDPKIYNFLEELKSGKGRRFELSDIVGHIVEFSADQHGSRFIQQKLENCTGEEKASVFKEVLPHASKLMTDVFGNYVIQKFFEYGSPEQRKELANQLTGQVLPLSLQMYGCRVIQKALEVIEPEQKAQLVRELDGHVMRCVRDQNGNHVIQKCIESVPTEKIGFIISAFRGQVAMLSMHPYGCRVIQRVLEHCTNELQCQFIVDEILESVCTLAQDQYGNYVTQHVLERGKPHERSQIISKLSGHIVQLSQHKFASNVIEKCLEYGGPTERELLIGEIFGHNEGTDNLLTMMKDQFANYVVQKILEICSDNQRAVLLARVRVHAHALKKYTYGKHIVARFELLFGEENPVAGS
ncbi:pumilio homolog 6, chloroplastic-like [Castanea sativa]|uniref:pumilio homolog 6, chloroplastic-like n=1 Tax=Castanea sativa TaxID=21020 RepID=UPI003F650433